MTCLECLLDFIESLESAEDLDFEDVCMQLDIANSLCVCRGGSLLDSGLEALKMFLGGAPQLGLYNFNNGANR